MPQSIYQTLNTAYHPPQKVSVPNDWAYIGQTVQSISPANGKPDFTKVPAWDIVGNLWVQLNADLDKVDYALSELKHNQVMLTVQDHLNFDYKDYTLVITSPGKPTRTITLADNVLHYLVENLVELSTYTFNLKANLFQGGQTGDSIQVITTPRNPIPLAPILTASNPTNSSITLNWTNPAGSTAIKYNIYIGQHGGNPWPWRIGATGSTVTITGLSQDTYYYYQITGVNNSDMEGKASNRMQWATGHNSVRNNSGTTSQPLHPTEWGSWRPDIGWKLWYSRSNWNVSVYQGYWQGPNNSGPTPRTIPSEESGRYRGVITYNGEDFRNRMDSWYGGGVAANLNISKVEIRRVYRMREPGNYDKQYMEWHLTNTNIFDAAAGPPIYDGFRNGGYNDADHIDAQDAMKAGTYILGVRLPRSWGWSLIHNNLRGTAVNGIMLYRGDHSNNGYGTAGYGEWAGHGRYDRSLSGAERYSDWTINIDATWNFEIVSYKGPFQW